MNLNAWAKTVGGLLQYASGILDNPASSPDNVRIVARNLMDSLGKTGGIVKALSEDHRRQAMQLEQARKLIKQQHKMMESANGSVDRQSSIHQGRVATNQGPDKDVQRKGWTPALRRRG